MDLLPADRTEPIVVVGDIKSRPANVAKIFGVSVIELEEPNKLFVIQRALCILGTRAREPLLIMDAEAKPLIPKLWHRRMLKNMTSENEAPVALVGPTYFTNGELLSRMLSSGHLVARALKRRIVNDSNKVSYQGPNLGLNLNCQHVLERVLGLPHLWYAEIAIGQTVLSSGGSIRYLMDPAMLTAAPPVNSLANPSERPVPKADTSSLGTLTRVDASSPGSITNHG